jgi:hypothetical protein
VKPGSINVPNSQILEEMADYFRAQGVHVDVVGPGGRPNPRNNCMCPICAAGRVDEKRNSSRMSPPEPEQESPAPAEECGDPLCCEQANPLADLANALDPGVKMTITIERSFRVSSSDDDEEGGAA